MFRYIFSIIIVFLIAHSSYGQYYSMGQDPGKTKWAQIKTEHFQVIFPNEFTLQGQEYANLLESSYKLVSYTMPNNAKRIPVVLHFETVISNGSVIWAPKRIELFMTASQHSYAGSWAEQLVSHELRHYVQISVLNQSTTKFLQFILGQQAIGAVLGLYIPLWFLEGDAVLSETVLSNSGRGRTPSFEMLLKAQLLEKGTYHYNKAYFGSYKDLVPNYYILGYHLVGMGRKNHGAGLWQKTLKNIAQKPFLIIPFSQGIKKCTGENKTSFYETSMQELDSLWRKQNEELDSIPYEVYSPSKGKEYISYQQPLLCDNNNLICIKSSLREIDELVVINNKKEERILFPGYYFDDKISISNNKICWAEKRYDARWDQRSWTNIKVYEIESDKQYVLRKKTKLFAPSFSADGKKIVCAEIKPDSNKLIILDAEDGEIIKKISVPNNSLILTPIWGKADSSIFTIAITENGKQIMEYHVFEDTWSVIGEGTYTEIKQPFCYKKYLFYTAAYNGIDNIYAYSFQKNSHFQLTSVKYGAEQVFVKNDSLFYSNYTANGYQIVCTPLEKTCWKALGEIEDNSIKLWKKPLTEEVGIIEKSILQDTTYEIKKYCKLSHLFNIHSWAPATINFSNYSINPGLSIYSQNALSTATTSMGFEYNYNDNTNKYFAQFEYEGFYPTIFMRAEHGKVKDSYENNNEIIPFYRMETDFKAGVSLPLLFTKNHYSQRFYLSTNYSLKSISHLISTPENYPKGFVQYNFNRLYVSNIRKTKSSNIYPYFGQILDFAAGFSISKGDMSLGKIYSVKSDFYFPGFAHDDGFLFQAAYQTKTNGGLYGFSDIIPNPRGYVNILADKIYTLKFNYATPILHPDLSLGSILYLKRVRINAFYDQCLSENNLYRSSGMDIIFDMHLLNFIAPISFGIRPTYLIGEQKFTYDILLNIGFDDL
jgi:hypothetical protein